VKKKYYEKLGTPYEEQQTKSIVLQHTIKVLMRDRKEVLSEKKE
jgi:hypothetical protein